METNQTPHPTTEIMEEVVLCLPVYEVRNLDHKMVLLNSQPVHSSMQYRKTDPRKTPQDMLAQGKENTGRRNDSLSIPSSASSQR